jgi:hypothetical protein
MAKAREAKGKSAYDVHPGVAMVQKWVTELKGKTGRSLEEWIALAKKEGPKEDKARREWLKTKHKLGTNSAWWISERVDGKGWRGRLAGSLFEDCDCVCRGAIRGSQAEVAAGL